MLIIVSKIKGFSDFTKRYYTKKYGKKHEPLTFGDVHYEWNDGTIDDLTYVFTILDKSLSTGAIVGIAVGSTAVISGIAYAIWSILKKKKLLLKK